MGYEIVIYLKSIKCLIFPSFPAFLLTSKMRETDTFRRAGMGIEGELFMFT